MVEEKAVPSDEADPGLEPLLTKEEDNKKVIKRDCEKPCIFPFKSKLTVCLSPK